MPLQYLGNTRIFGDSLTPMEFVCDVYSTIGSGEGVNQTSIAGRDALLDTFKGETCSWVSEEKKTQCSAMFTEFRTLLLLAQFFE